MSVLPSREPKAVAQRAVREAAYFAVVLVLLRLIFAVVSLIQPKPGTDRLLYVGSIFDGLLLAGLAYGVFRISRLCTILLLVYLVVDQAAKIGSPTSAGGGIADLFVVLGAFVLSIRAIVFSFRYHAMVREQQSDSTVSHSEASKPS